MSEDENHIVPEEQDQSEEVAEDPQQAGHQAPHRRHGLHTL